MKFLGILLLLGLLFVAVGFVRGWFTVVDYGAGDSVTVGIDRDKAKGDGRAVLDAVGVQSARTTPVSASANVAEGKLTVVDTTAKNITVDVRDRSSIHHVANTVAITRDGARIDFGMLRPNTKVRLSFDESRPIPHLLVVEILD